MTLEKFKSIVYNYITDINITNPKVYYNKIYLYDEIKKKLYHNLTVMPKDELDGKVSIWKLEKNKVSRLVLPMEEEFQKWKENYKKFINNFSADFYVYYIFTINEKLNKIYRTMIVLLPKEKPFEYSKKLIKNNEIGIEYFIKDNFVSKLDEQLKLETKQK
jgi:hypothetical protein